jgi:hypothetical protein
MKKYFIMAIELGNSKTLYCLGTYYWKIEKNHKLMKMYYQVAIQKNNIKAMYYLGLYYFGKRITKYLSFNTKNIK